MRKRKYQYGKENTKKKLRVLEENIECARDILMKIINPFMTVFFFGLYIAFRYIAWQREG